MLDTLIIHFIFTMTIFALVLYVGSEKRSLYFISAFKYILGVHLALLSVMSILAQQYTKIMVFYSFVSMLIGLAINLACTELISKKLYVRMSDAIFLSQRMYLMPLYLIINLRAVLQISNEF